MKIGKATLLVLSLPAACAATWVGIFNIAAAIGNENYYQLVYCVPFFAVPALWSAYAVGETNAEQKEETKKA